MSYFNIVYDVCGRGAQGITRVNGMKFCTKCYQVTFGNNTSKFVDLLNTEMYELKISNLEHKLNEKDQQIAELEEQLKNSIRPKFKIGQEVWFVSDPYTARYAKVRHMKIEEISISSIFVERGVMYAGDDWAGISESELFATKEEAEQKLAELKGE